MFVILDFALERFELDKMRAKTRQVKRRMSHAVGDGDSAISSSNLDMESVEQFLKNTNLWEKYKSG